MWGVKKQTHGARSPFWTFVVLNYLYLNIHISLTTDTCCYYNRIRLLNAFANNIKKVIEKVISQLSEYFEESQLFAENQYRFQSGHSTKYDALELVDRITTQMDNSKIPINILLDLSKAFDTIDHKILESCRDWDP